MSDSSEDDETIEHEKKNSSKQHRNSKKNFIKQNSRNPANLGEPCLIKRKLDPNAVVIHRRFDEGSKPLFDRADVRVNPSPSKSPCKKSTHKNKSTSPLSSTRNSERNTSRNRNHHSTSAAVHKEKLSHSPKHKKNPERVPYFADPIREQDRINQKYRNQRRRFRSSRSSSRTKRRSRSFSYGSSRRRHRSPSYHGSHSYRRSSSRERRTRRRRPRSRSSSRSHSKSRSRRTPPYDNTIATPQYIPVPTIPVPIEYAPSPARWMAPPPPHMYPRYPVMPRPTLYHHPYVSYYPGFGIPVAAPYQPNRPPRFRGRLNKPNYQSNKS